MKKRFGLVLFCLILSLQLTAKAQDSTLVTETLPDTLVANSTQIVVATPLIDTVAITPKPVSFSTTRIITSRDFSSIPDANIISIVSATNGVVNGNGSLYFRGSRSDEIAYFIDGFAVNEQYTGEIGTPINLAAIEELSVITGGWGSEIGGAMGGIVNFKTKESHG